MSEDIRSASDRLVSMLASCSLCSLEDGLKYEGEIGDTAAEYVCSMHGSEFDAGDALHGRMVVRYKIWLFGEGEEEKAERLSKDVPPSEYDNDRNLIKIEGCLAGNKPCETLRKSAVFALNSRAKKFKGRQELCFAEDPVTKLFGMENDDAKELGRALSEADPYHTDNKAWEFYGFLNACKGIIDISSYDHASFAFQPLGYYPILDDIDLHRIENVEGILKEAGMTVKEYYETVAEADCMLGWKMRKAYEKYADDLSIDRLARSMEGHSDEKLAKRLLNNRNIGFVFS